MLLGARTNAGDVVKLPLIIWLRKETTWTVLPRPISSGSGKKKQEFSLLSLHDINKKLLPSLYRLPVHASHNSKVTPYISEEYRLKYPLKHAFTISVRKKLSA
jgi:hypothetical protein